MTDRDRKYSERIRALLAKAESTTPEEAELLVAKAQELMTKYAISEALIAQAAGLHVDEIGQEEIRLAGQFMFDLMTLTSTVARANNTKGVYRTHKSWQAPIEVNGKMYRNAIICTVTGYRSDIDRVMLLNSSLQIQCARAQLDWWKNHPSRSWLTQSDALRERKQFIRGFTTAVRNRLKESNARAEAEAADDEAGRSGGTVEQATESVALVLRSRKDQVSDWYDEKYGKSLRTVSRSYRSGSRSAGDAGRAAGSRADLGQTRIGSPGQLARAS